MEILNNTENSRFELEVESNLAYLNYVIAMGHFCINHTEVPEELKGQGIGGKLVRHAIDFGVANNMKIFPFCPFAASYIKKNEELLPFVGKGFKWENVLN